MAERQPQFEQESLNPEKEARWKEVEEMIDGFGDVEEQIKKPVIALNALGLPTTNSCEGHENHGRIVPYVTIGAPNEPKEKYVGQKDFEQEVYQKYGVSQDLRNREADYLKEYREKADEYAREIRSKFGRVEFSTDEDQKKLEKLNKRAMKKYGISQKNIEKIIDAMRKMPEEIEDAVSKGILKEKTPESIKWEEEMQKLQSRVSELLEEFYRDRESPGNVKLILHKGFRMSDFFLRNEGGGDYVELDKKMTEKEMKDYEDILEGKIPRKKQEELKKRIELYRLEFKEFAEFLKQKFFKE